MNARRALSIAAGVFLVLFAGSVWGDEQQPIAPASPPAGAVALDPDEHPQTLLSGRVSHGGFGGPVLGYSTLNGEGALIVGGRGGWLLNHRFVVGGGGYGVTNRVSVPPGATASDADHQLAFGYGGFWTEYIIAPSRLVHGSVGVLLGAGGLVYHRFRPHGQQGDMANDAVFVVDPTLSVEVNLVGFLRLALFANYRVIDGVDLEGLRDADVSGFGAGAMLKFGRF